MKKALILLNLIIFYFPVSAQKQWEWFLEPTYHYLGDFSEGLASIKINEKWGFINHRGKMVVPAKYTSAGSFSEGLASVKLGKKSGFINKKGNIAIQFKSVDYGSFSNGRAVFFKASTNPQASPYETTYGYINKQGQIAIPDRYHINPNTSYTFAEGMCMVPDSKGQFMDVHGKILPNTTYSMVQNFSGGLAAVQDSQTSKWGFINKAGKLVIPCQFYEVDYEGFKNGMCAVALKYNHWIFINTSGKKVFAQVFAKATCFLEGRAVVGLKINGKLKFGFINTSGKMMISPQFEAYKYKNFSEGLAAVQTAGRWGFINSKGKTVIAPQFEKTGNFKEGKCRVKLNGKWGIIQKK